MFMMESSIIGGGGGTWGSPAPTTNSVISGGSGSYYTSSAPAPVAAALAPSAAPGLRLSAAGPFGEGTFTPLDYPLMRSLFEGERLEVLNNQTGMVGSALTGMDKMLLAVLLGLLVFKK